MSKLYYIPLEIGAWVKDTSCVGMEVQGCLLNLIFKLWDSDDKGRLSISFSQLAFLFKKTPEECKKIVAEIAENTLLNVEFLPDGRVKFESRRMLKEAAKSLTLSANGKKGGRGKKANQKQKQSKSKAKTKQIPDYDYDSNYDSNSINKSRDRGAGEREESVTRVLENFVSITGRKIDINIESNRRPVRARLKEGFTEPDLMDLGAYMKCLWEDNPNMKQHIQIDTIYGTKCDKYRVLMNEAKEKGLTASQIKGPKRNGNENLAAEVAESLRRKFATA